MAGSRFDHESVSRLFRYRHYGWKCKIQHRGPRSQCCWIRGVADPTQQVQKLQVVHQKERFANNAEWQLRTSGGHCSKAFLCWKKTWWRAHTASKLNMDQTTTSRITISTQNVNGYSRNKDFLFTLCEENKNSIRAIQEHWLKPPYKNHSGVNQMRNLHPEFDGFGTSAMKKSVDSQILKGRPYGYGLFVQ